MLEGFLSISAELTQTNLRGPGSTDGQAGLEASNSLANLCLQRTGVSVDATSQGEEDLLTDLRV